MGWLGLNEMDALSANVNNIMVAMEGRVEMMYPEVLKEKKKDISRDFKSFVAHHNEAYKK